MSDNEKQFTAVVEDFVAKSPERMLAVVRGSLRDVIDMAQVPVAKGGRMRVDTGFLRASGRASLTGLPSGNGQRPPNALKNQFQFDGEAVNATLLKMQLGDTFYWGWIANYAQVRELYDGFLGMAIQRWQEIVSANSEKFRGK